MMNRRGFLGALLAAPLAPIVRTFRWSTRTGLIGQIDRATYPFWRSQRPLLTVDAVNHLTKMAYLPALDDLFTRESPLLTYMKEHPHGQTPDHAQ